MGKLVFAGDGKISFEICSTQWVTVKIGINGLAPDLYQNKHRINPEYLEIEFYLLGMAGHAE